MGEVGSARYEPALLHPCPSIRALCYSNCQRSTQSHQQSKGYIFDTYLTHVLQSKEVELNALIDKVKQQEIHHKKHTEQLRQEGQDQVHFYL